MKNEKRWTREKKGEVKEEERIHWSDSTGDGRVESEFGQWGRSDEVTAFTRDCNTPSMSEMLIARDCNTSSVLGMQRTAMAEVANGGNSEQSGQKGGRRSSKGAQDDREKMRVGSRRCYLERGR